jgi:ABC-type glycerol-3-phosphate transport system permease component
MYKAHKLALTVIVVAAIMQVSGARNDNILGLVCVATILILLVLLANCFNCGRWFVPGIAAAVVKS